MKGPDDSFRHGGFIALRTPLLSFDTLRLGDGAQRTENLQRVVKEPTVREAIFLASPGLEGRIDDWAEGRLDQADASKVERSLSRYLVRMCSRPTPFGTLAGTSVGTIGDATTFRLAAPSQHRRTTRLDMHYLAALALSATGDDALRRNLRWRPNTSIYEAGGRLRLVEGREESGTRLYRLIAIDPSEGITIVLEKAAGGASFAELTAALVDDQVSTEEAEAFVAELIEAQLLVSDLEPPVTGRDALDAMIETLERSCPSLSVTSTLAEVRDRLAELDSEGLGAEIDRYRALAADLEAVVPRADRARLFQVDMVPATETAQLGKDIIADLTVAIQALHRMMPPPEEDALARFRRAFQERYEGREVALTDALDEETGIGFEASRAPAADASPLLAGLPFDLDEPATRYWGKRQSFLLRRLEEIWATGADEMTLTQEELSLLAIEDMGALPDAFAALCSVAAPGPGARVCLHGVSGPSGALLLGRLCLADPALEQRVTEHLRQEEELRPGTIFAEIVHLPEGRIGNILARPVLRSHEIPFLGRSGAAASAQIPVADLTVSVSGERIVLRSRRLNKEVLPRLTSAHNYGRRSLGTYRFLCALRHQGVAGGIVWRWGPFESARFLPRVVIGRVVVSRARWRLSPAELSEVASEGARLPRFVALQDADNELLVDLDDDVAVEGLVTLVKRRPFVQLVEMWPPPERLCVDGPGGAFTNEVVVPFVRDRVPSSVPPEPRAHVPIARRFTPGSEWLYVKLFTGTAGVDVLLRDIAGPAAREAMRRDRIRSWFFARYGDPHWHLRLRFEGPPDGLKAVLDDLRSRCEQGLSDGSLWRIQLDTYEREVERYGGAAGMAVVEEIFHIDSKAVVEILGTDAARPESRWRVALAGVDALFRDLDLDPEARLATARALRDAFAREWSSREELSRAIGRSFRGYRKELEMFIGAESLPGIPAEAAEMLRSRSRRLAEPLLELRRLDAAGELTVPAREIATSLAHMHVNRMLRSAHRAHEAVMYDFLARLYASESARASR